MAEFRNRGDGANNPHLADETVSKVGRAVGRIAMIRDAYQDGVKNVKSDGEKEELAQRAEVAAVAVLNEQGVSIAEYNHVMAAADEDPALQQRLLAAAQAD